MKRIMKRIIALLLCLMLMMSMATTVFAENENTESPEGNNGTPVVYEKVDLVINGRASGHSYIAYQIFKGNAAIKDDDQILANIAWGDAIKNSANLITVLKSDITPITNSTNTNEGTTLANEFKNSAATAEGIAATMTAWGDNMDRIKYFADLLWYGKYKDNNGPQEAVLLDTTKGVTNTKAEGTTYTFENLESGYYLIMDADDYPNDRLEDFSTQFIVAVTSKTNITVKGEIPTVMKKASNSLNGPYTEFISNQIGAPVHYYEWNGSIVSDVAQYKTYQYGFVDTMSEGLTFNRIEQVMIKSQTDEYVIYALNDQGEPVNNNDVVFEKDTEGKYILPFTFTKTESKDNDGNITSTEIRLFFDDLKAIYPHLLKSDSVIVRYSATLNANAVIADVGNPNNVVLHYANNPHGDGTGYTQPDEARVYTFGMKLTKVNESNTPLAGAHFVLAHLHSEGTEITPVYAKVTYAKKSVTVTDENNETSTQLVDDTSKGVITGWTEVRSEATELISDENGHLEFIGLKDTTDYYLAETKAPEGYNQLLGNTEIQINGFTVNDSNEVTSLTYQVNDETTVKSIIDDDQTNNDLVVTLSVTNKSGTVLPSTGGMGTTIIYAAGAILVLVAVVLLITKKRMTNAE